MATTTIRLGTASPGTLASRAATLRQLAALASRAAAQHIDLVLLPEAYIGGYPRGTHFGCVVGDRTRDGREEFARYFDGAVDLGDTVGEGGGGAGERWVKRQLGGGGGGEEARQRGDGTREELERIAQETGVFLVVGLIEKAGGTLYCSVVYVCPKEGMLGKRRKVMPANEKPNSKTGTERLCWGQGSPSTLRAVSTTLRGVRVNLAAAICWESYMPLLRQALYAQNVNLYLAPTADNRDAWMALMRTVAVEGRCFVVSSNMCVRDSSSSSSSSWSSAINTTTTTTNINGITNEDPSSPLSPLTRTQQRHRRNSAVTADGHEIVLPSSPTRRARRRSVFDSDGNEIVLSCAADTQPAPAAVPATTTTAAAAAAAATTTTTNGEAGDATPKAAGMAPGWLSRGGSAIVSPYGDVIAGPQWEDPEGLIWQDVDMRDCVRGRLDLDAAGSYSRNDAFRLSVTGLDLDPLPY
ncbi:hypothetical protein G3M48_005158 [Beauveria asiatica]|uniref:CN hydrolase domain-containing protein n=1 Tax=Beauveria asiatica TaxID=1069075 RepID=A0AAW0RS53_9HYPO